MKPVEGGASITLGPVTVEPPSPPGTYIGVAAGLLPGAQLLATGGASCSRALAFVSAHIVECALKASISGVDGTDEALKTPDVRHDLLALWELARVQGLSLSDPAPDWLQRLNALHNRPFHLRYATGVHGLVLPAPEPMVSDLAALLTRVQEGTRKLPERAP